ncbi:hypothetical protein K461DRAFT_279701 [Myriangium duriaei CBS 260.36]|uniref:Uncharacterized protein n=1 Tax=Myriangium duriaei CBS 260.36 TaxID=1168546 RepID=A0A9P4J4F4_9PEZI|nr:hypothetical protein K461DRAFT_279701 [Myriangium duriaei CBS 260.36]
MNASGDISFAVILLNTISNIQISRQAKAVACMILAMGTQESVASAVRRNQRALCAYDDRG